MIEPDLLQKAYENGDFVDVKGSDKCWVRIASAGDMTLIATWVRNNLIADKDKDK